MGDSVLVGTVLIVVRSVLVGTAHFEFHSVLVGTAEAWPTVGFICFVAEVVVVEVGLMLGGRLVEGGAWR